MKQRIQTLIVNDESTIRDTIRALLRNSAEFEIADDCESGLEAIEKIQRQTLDLVFLDLQMPDFGAFEIIEKIGVNQMPATILIATYIYAGFCKLSFFNCLLHSKSSDSLSTS